MNWTRTNTDGHGRARTGIGLDEAAFFVVMALLAVVSATIFAPVLGAIFY